MNPEGKVEYGVWSVAAFILVLLTNWPSIQENVSWHCKGGGDSQVRQWGKATWHQGRLCH